MLLSRGKMYSTNLQCVSSGGGRSNWRLYTRQRHGCCHPPHRPAHCSLSHPPSSTRRWSDQVDSVLWNAVMARDSVFAIGLKAPGLGRGVTRGKVTISRNTWLGAIHAITARGDVMSYSPACSHGTRIAGLATAPRDGSSIVGAAYRANLYSVYQADSENPDVENAGLAIHDAVVNGHARVVIMAWGGRELV